MFYIYKITCNHPTKLSGYIYYGKHKHKDPYKNNYMGGGQVLVAAQNTIGIKYFTKEVIAVYDSDKEVKKHEKELVSKSFVSEKRNFNVATGGGARNRNSAHQWKKEAMRDLEDAEEANIRGLTLAEYRKLMDERIDQLYHDNGVGVL